MPLSAPYQGVVSTPYQPPASGALTPIAAPGPASGSPGAWAPAPTYPPTSPTYPPTYLGQGVTTVSQPVDPATIATRGQRAGTQRGLSSRSGEALTALGAVVALITVAFPWFTIHFDFGALYTGTTILRAWDFVGGLIALAAVALALLGVALVLLRVKIALPLPAGAHYLLFGAIALAGLGVYLYRASAILTGQATGITAQPAPALYAAFAGAALVVIGGAVSLVMRVRP